MTIADIKVQQLLVNSIRKFWPKIKIIGEENVEFDGQIDFDYNTLNPQLLDEKLFMLGKNQYKINNEFDIDNVVVFIDPLDGTLSYTKNELDAITTLIGISYNNQPLIGIIGQPFQNVPKSTANKEEEEKKDSANSASQMEYIFDPMVYFGHAYQDYIYSIFCRDFGKQPPTVIKKKQPTQSNKPLVALTSLHHIN